MQNIEDRIFLIVCFLVGLLIGVLLGEFFIERRTTKRLPACVESFKADIEALDYCLNQEMGFKDE